MRDDSGAAGVLFDLVPVPQPGEFRTPPPEFVDQGQQAGIVDVVRGLGTEARHQAGGLLVPTGVAFAHRRIREEVPEYVVVRAFRTEQRAGGEIRAHDVPAVVHDVRRIGRPIVDVGVQGFRPRMPDRVRPVEVGRTEPPQIPALRVVQLQNVGDAVQNLAGDIGSPPLFDPRVPGDSDAGEQRDLLTPEPGTAS